MKTSVIIPTRNREEDLIKCLSSIEKQTLMPNEVVIIDSSKNKFKNYNKFKLNIKYFHTFKFGNARQRNIGAKKSSGDIIVFSDDDTIWDENYLKELIKVFNMNYEENIINVGGVTGMPILKEKTFNKKILGYVPKIISLLFMLPRNSNDGKFQISGCSTIITDSEEIKDCEFLYGFSMAFKKEVFQEFKMDDNVSGYIWNDDDDLAYRVSRKYQNYFVPTAKILHNQMGNKNINYTFIKQRIKQHYYFYKKNLPKNLKTIIAFYWSCLGFIIHDYLFMVYQWSKR